MFNRAGCTLIDSRPMATSTSSEPINAMVDPIQENFDTTAEVPIIKDVDGHRTLIIPKASYKIAGRVLSKRHYYMDWMAKLSPVDLALGWGPLATHQYDKFLSFSHSHRYYNYHYNQNFPEDASVIGTHSANEHLIPATMQIAKALKSIKIDEVVEIEGFLVNIEAYDKGHETISLTSSLIRTDTGAGACEIIYVTKLKIKHEIFQ